MPRGTGVGVVFLVSALLALGALAQGAGAASCVLGVCLSPSQAGGTGPKAPSATAAGQQRGFSDAGLGRADLPRSVFLDRMSQSGARLHRVALRWQRYEPEPGVYKAGYLADHDRNYNDELARGVRQVIVLIGTPYWALTPKGRGASSPEGVWRCDAAGQDPCNAPPNVRDPAIRAAWKRWVATVVARYPKAAGIEIWNEPNLRWNWFQAQDPELYALMLQAADEAAEEEGSSVPVVSGGISTFLGASDVERTNYEEFVRKIYQVAGPDGFDGIGWHAYACNWQKSYHSVAERHLGILQAIKRDFSDSAKPLWLTETGATTGPPSPATCSTTFSEDQQRAAVADVLDWAVGAQVASKDLPVVLVHSLFDFNEEAPLAEHGDLEGGFGLLTWSRDPLTGRVRTREKPAYQTVRCRYRGTC